MGFLFAKRQDHVCSALRMTRETFALLPLLVVFVHVADVRVDPATGHPGFVPVLSVAFDRELDPVGHAPAPGAPSGPTHRIVGHHRSQVRQVADSTSRDAATLRSGSSPFKVSWDLERGGP